MTNSHSLVEQESGLPVVVVQPPFALIVNEAMAVAASRLVAANARTVDRAMILTDPHFRAISKTDMQ
jgi:hypothetical protein